MGPVLLGLVPADVGVDAGPVFGSVVASRALEEHSALVVGEQVLVERRRIPGAVFTLWAAEDLVGRRFVLGRPQVALVLVTVPNVIEDGNVGRIVAVRTGEFA